MKTLLISVLILFTGVYTTLRAQSTKLDGKTFQIKLTITKGNPKAGSTWTKDVITFSEGNLNAEFMAEHEGFPPAACKIKVDSASGEITFSASHKNKGGSNIKWEGKIVGDKIEGTAIWKNIHGPRAYSFTGTLKKEK